MTGGASGMRGEPHKDTVNIPTEFWMPIMRKTRSTYLGAAHCHRGMPKNVSTVLLSAICRPDT